MGKFGIADIFTDNCVFTRRKPVCIYGKGEEGKTVRVSLGEALLDTRVCNDGTWKAYLPSMEAATGLELTVSCEGENFSFKNIAIGEVWLAGGQSNMEYELQNATGGLEHLNHDNPNVRFFYTPKNAYECKERDRAFEEAHWQLFDKEDSKNWSAVGYLFAKELSEKLGVTVGVIGCNYGGTSASAWISREDMIKGPKGVKSYWDEYTEFNKGKSLETQKAEYDDYLAYRAEWEPKCNKLYADNPRIEWGDVLKLIGDSRYPGPINAYNPMRPAGLYEMMLKEVISYSLSGVIYYQGESDDHKPYVYEDLFGKLIDRWRMDNGDLELPFIGVQLPMHRYRQDPDFKNWPVIRLKQRITVRNHDNAYLAVAIDCGEFDEIHPHNKTDVAHRLCLQALCYVYGLTDERSANGPRAWRLDFKPGYVDVSFDFAEGFEVRADEITGFEIAPAKFTYSDEDFVPAKAEIIGKDKIRLTAPGVGYPGNARYLYTNWGNVTLFGENGLPVEPF